MYGLWHNASHMKDLTPRQLDVLRLLSEGRRNRDIARVLGVTPSAVSNCIVALYARIGVETRLEAALWFRDHRAELEAA